VRQACLVPSNNDPGQVRTLVQEHVERPCQLGRDVGLDDDLGGAEGCHDLMMKLTKVPTSGGHSQRSADRSTTDSTGTTGSR